MDHILYFTMDVFTFTIALFEQVHCEMCVLASCLLIDLQYKHFFFVVNKSKCPIRVPPWGEKHFVFGGQNICRSAGQLLCNLSEYLLSHSFTIHLVTYI